MSDPASPSADRPAGEPKSFSLAAYLVIAQHERLLHLHSRAGDIWREHSVTAGSIVLDDPPVTLELGLI